MRFERLSDWLAWQETLHPTAIDLGLDRVARVAERLNVAQPPFAVITVAGTNGKGTTVAVMEAVLRAAGFRVGAYTSPHLLRYNERVRIDGQPVADAALCAAFERVDRARGDTSLSYFEFGTLAALDRFHRADLDVALLEVGLGGRLDAVNVVAPDVAVITTVDLDHTQWLGPDRERIGAEKAGILRPGRPAVAGDPDLPESVRARAEALGAPLAVPGREYGFEPASPTHWHWWDGERRLADLPRPPLAGRAALSNAAAALAALQRLPARFAPPRAAVEAGLRSVSLPGRFQVMGGAVERVFDVAHNPQAARHLADLLRERPVPGRTRAVAGVLADKDVSGTLSPLSPCIHEWHLATLAGPRGLAGADLAAVLMEAAPDAPCRTHVDVRTAYREALAASAAGDRVVVFGSFLTVAAALEEATCPPADAARQPTSDNDG